MLTVLKTCFPREMQTTAWQEKISNMIPTYGKSLAADGTLCRETRARTAELLQLNAKR
jgi:malate dehydrogenase (quinone)